jgi:hypothetical protein
VPVGQLEDVVEFPKSVWPPSKDNCIVKPVTPPVVAFPHHKVTFMSSMVQLPVNEENDPPAGQLKLENGTNNLLVLPPVAVAI